MTPKPSSYCVDCNGPCTATKLHGIPKTRVTSGSRIFSGNVVGKKLADRQISKYEQNGKYGTPLFKLPAKTGSRCQNCQGTKDVKRKEYSYLPTPGFYCLACIEQFRSERDKAKELTARIRRAMREDYV